MATHNIYEKLARAEMPATGTILDVPSADGKLIHWEAAAPSGSEVGYTPGAMWIDTSGASVSVNTGTALVASWSNLATLGGAHPSTSNLALDDDIELRFGNSADVTMDWDSANGWLVMKPLTDDTGAFYIGNRTGTKYMDFAWTSGTNTGVTFDYGGLLVAYSKVDLRMNDDAELRFGSAGYDNSSSPTDYDVTMQWVSASDILQILPYTDDTGAIHIGNGTNDIDLKVFMGSAGAYVEFDNSAQVVKFEGTAARMMDDDNLEFGDDADLLMDWDGSNFVIQPKTDDTGIFTFGTTTAGMDLLWYSNTAAGTVTFDYGAQLCTFNGVDLRINDDDMIEFGDGADAMLIWETADTNAHELLLELPAGGGANNVPVLVMGIAIENVNLGLFDGATFPTLAILDINQDSYLKLDHSADNIPQIAVGGSATYLLSSTAIRIADDTDLAFGASAIIMMEYDADGTDDLRVDTAAAGGHGFVWTAGTGLAGDNAGGGWTVLCGIGGAASAALSGNGGAVSITSGAGAGETTGAAGNGGAVGLTAGVGGETSGASGVGGPGGTVTITAGTGGADDDGNSGTGGDAGDITLKLGDFGAGDTDGSAGVVQFLPTTTDSGAVHVGNGTLDMDFKVFMDSVNAYVNFDQASQTVVFEATTINLMDNDALLLGDSSDVSVDYDSGSGQIHIIGLVDTGVGVKVTASAGADGATNAGGAFDFDTGEGGNGAGAGTAGAGGAYALNTGAGGTETSGTCGAGGAIGLTCGIGGAASAHGDGGDGGAITLTSGTGGADTAGASGSGGDAGAIILKLGNLGAGFVAGSAGLIQLLPTATDVGAVNIGNGTLDMDLKIFMDSAAAFVNFDQSAQEVIFEGTFINMMDDDSIRFGDGEDMVMKFVSAGNMFGALGTALLGTGFDWDAGTGHNVTGATDATVHGGAFQVATGAGGTSVTGNAGNGGDFTIAAADGGASSGAAGQGGVGGSLTITAGTGGDDSDGTAGVGGNAGSITITVGDIGASATGTPGTAGVIEFLSTTTNVGAVNIGDGTTDLDFKVFMDSTSAYVLFDQDAQLCIFEGTALRMNDNDTLIFGDDSDSVIDFDEAGNDDLQIQGNDNLGVGLRIDGGNAAAGTNIGGLLQSVGGVGGTGTGGGTAGAGGAQNIVGGAGGTETSGTCGAGGATTLVGGIGGAASANGDGGDGGAINITSGNGGADTAAASGSGGDAGDIIVTLGDVGAGFAAGTAGLVQFLPSTDDSGAVNVGNGTADLDFKVFMGSTSAFVNFDNGSQLVTFEGTALIFMDDDTLLFGDASEFTIDYDEAGTDDLRFVAAADKTLGYYFIAGTGADGGTLAGGIFDVVTGAGGAGAGGGTAGAGGAMNLSTGAGGTETTGDGGAGGLLTIDAGVGGATDAAAGDGGDGGSIAITSGTGGADGENGSGTGGDAGSIVITLGDAGAGFAAGSAGLVQFLSSTDDSGAVHVGDGTTDLDFKVFMGSAGAYVNFDTGSQLVKVEGTDVQFMDDDLILFGDLSGGDATLGYISTPHALVLDPIGSHVAFPGLSHRLELRHQFGGVEGSIPQTIGSYAVNLLTDQQFILSGTGIADGSAVATAEGGITLAVQAGDGNEAIIIPNSTAGCVWDDVTWGTDQETRYEALITTTAGIANCIIWVGLKLTETEVMITDADQALFRYENGVNSGKWEAITSVANSDDAHDSGVTVATTTTYHLVISIDSSRIPKYYIDGVLVETGSALTSTDFIPYIGVADDGGAVGNSIIVRSCFIARNYA